MSKPLEHRGKYAIARKGKWYILRTCESYEKAQELIKGKENLMEIRKVYE